MVIHELWTDYQGTVCVRERQAWLLFGFIPLYIHTSFDDRRERTAEEISRRLRAMETAPTNEWSGPAC